MANPETESKLGRPSAYTPEIAAEICSRMSSGQSLRQICRDESMPSMSMVMRWAASNEAFREQYRCAREDLLEHWAEDIIEISDDGSRDYIETDLGDGVVGSKVDHDHIARSKLRVDSRKWLLARLAAKKYGDRISTEVSGPGGGPIEYRDMTETEISSRLAALMSAASLAGSSSDDSDSTTDQSAG